MASDTSPGSSYPHQSWDQAAADACGNELEVRALASRWIGRDESLALYGGGNTSMKSATVTGEACLYVKATGADLAEVTARDFTAVRLAAAQSLLDGPPLDNRALSEALDRVRLDDHASRPSIETLLHASLPRRFVEHAHADAVLAVVNTESRERLAHRVFRERAPLVPFRESGYELARACRSELADRGSAATIGLILSFHGVVAFGDTPRESFENLLSLVGDAETYLEASNAWNLPRAARPTRSWHDALTLARLRRALSRAAGFPLTLCLDDSAEAMAFARHENLVALAGEGPPTPQHAVFTKRIPSLGFDVEAYADAYRDYLRECGGDLPSDRFPDPAPRVLIDPAFGIVSAAVDARHARMTRTVYRHDREIILRASLHDRYRSLPRGEILAAEVHYGGFERALLARRETDLPLLGCVIALAPDIEVDYPALAPLLDAAGASTLVLDPADDAAVMDAAYRFGGLDVCVFGRASSLSARLEALLALSPGGGIVTEHDAYVSDETLCNALAARWHVGLGLEGRR